MEKMIFAENDFNQYGSIKIPSNKKIRKAINKNPFIDFVDMDAYFTKFPTKVSYRKGLTVDYDYKKQNSYKKADEYDVLETICKTKNIQVNPLYNEVRTKFLE